MKSFLPYAVVFISLSLLNFLPAEEIRSWSDQSGKFSVRATALEFDGNEVVLQKEDERILRLPLSKLSRNDQAYLKAKGPFKAEENPFAETTGDDDGYDAGKIVFPDEPRPIQTDKTVIVPPGETDWKYQPDPAKDTTLPKAEPLRFSLGRLDHDWSERWSDLFFNHARPSNVLAVANMAHRTKPESATAKIFSADIGTGEIVSADFPGGYSLLDLSPDGTRLLLRPTSPDSFRSYRDKSPRIHVVRLSRDLRVTHQACYEPFALEGWGVEEKSLAQKSFLDMEPEGREADRKKRDDEFQQRMERSRAENEARRKMTPEERAAEFKKKMEQNRGALQGGTPNAAKQEEAKKDRLGRAIPARSGISTENAANVHRGFWLDNQRVLLQSGGNCLITMNVDTGEVLWSIPPAGANLPAPIVLSPGKRYCLVSSPEKPSASDVTPVREGVVSVRSALQATPTELSRAAESRTSSRTISSELSNADSLPMLLFDMNELRFCGRLERAKECSGIKRFDFSPDGKTLGAFGGDSSVLRWNMKDGTLLPTIYFSLPHHEENRMNTPSGSIEKVYDNQEKSSVFCWADNRYLKAGSVLIDTVSEMPVWRYVTFNTAFEKNFGRYYWFVQDLGDMLEVIPRRIPSSRVPEKERTGPDPNAYLVVPGTEVALRVDNSITKDKDRITEALGKKITNNGWILNPDASVFLMARITREPRNLYIQRDIRQISGAALTFEPGPDSVRIASFSMPRYEITIKKDAQVLWTISALPRLPRISMESIKNQTAQDHLEKGLSDMNYSEWFSGVLIPRKLRIETPLKETSIQMPGAD